jgi:transposase
MSRFVEGEDRWQPALLPSCLEDYVTEENPARVIDVFVNELDLGGLGFVVTTVRWAGRRTIRRRC